MIWLQWLAFAILLLLLTALTQIGGVALIVALIVGGLLGRHGRSPIACWLIAGVLFAATYSLVSFVAVPPLAAALGRQALPCWELQGYGYAARSKLTCLLNRHYALPSVHVVLDDLSAALRARHPDTVVAFLDAGFPFGDRFPMLPHLSHDDGRRIDLAFFYGNADGRYRPLKTPSPIGYWAFEAPVAEEPQPCRGNDEPITLRWDMTALQPLWPPLVLDEARTAGMVRWLVSDGRKSGVRSVLLEPHLKARWRISSDAVKFQGCHAARHDDHIHVKVR